MKRLLFLSIFLAAPALAEPVVSIPKNTTLKFCGSIYDATTAKRLTAAVTGIDCEYAQVIPASTDESAFTDLSTAERVVGTVGQFCYTITATEDNIDGWIRVSCKATNTNAADYEQTFTTLGTSIATDGATAASFAADGAVQAGSGTSIQLAAAETYADSELVGRQICIVAGVGKGQCREITANVGATDTVTITPTLTTTPLDTTSKYVIGGVSRFALTMSTDAYSELSAVPGATPTLAQMIQWIYEIHRFKLEQTSATTTLRKADSATSLSTSTVSDDGTTFNRGKFN